ncbi:MAG TPA: MipA/OmpV family protein [Opitutaceae bacterium]|nr:MipA/OmpV family protein [Opitutaceae bacterium]
MLLIPASARSEEDTWTTTLGGGLTVRPTFEGSDRYTVSPAPLVVIVWNDMLALDDKGLNGYWHRENLRIGGGLTYDSGRREKEELFSQGDGRLRGLGNIDGALGLRAFASYDFGPVLVEGAAIKFTGTDNKGVLTDLVASIPYRPSRKLSIRPLLGATWADDRYMRTFFGVTAMQSASSGFAPFHAGAGFKSFTAGVKFAYLFNPHWMLLGGAHIEQLTGDGGKSPIVFSKTGALFTVMLGYNF